MNSKHYNPFETEQKQFDRAANLLELDSCGYSKPYPSKKQLILPNLA